MTTRYSLRGAKSSAQQSGPGNGHKSPKKGMEKAKKVAGPEEIVNATFHTPMMNEQTEPKGKRKQPSTPTEAKPAKAAKPAAAKEGENRKQKQKPKTALAKNTAAGPPEMPNQDAQKWREWIFRGFDDRATVSDQQNAEQMFNYLRNVRPVHTCCKKIGRGGKKEVVCQCLMRIQVGLQIASTQDQEKWKVLFTKFSRVLRPIARAGDAVTSMIKFLHEFQHTCTMTSSKHVKSYVVKTPIGPLLMDFNGLSELGGYAQRDAYADFYSKYLTGIKKEHAAESSYVQRAYKHRGHLSAFLDIVEFCSQKQKHPTIKTQQFEKSLCSNICKYRRENGYYLNDPANFVYSSSSKKKPSENAQETTDTNKNIPPAKKYMKHMGDDFIIGHPNIPLFTPDSDGCPTDPKEPYIILQTHGEANGDRICTNGHVGIMQDDLDNLAGMLVKPLLQLVGWDGKKEQGTRDISFLIHGRDDIQPQLQVLQENMVMACRKLLPSLRPDARMEFKIHCEAFLCPAPLLNERYQWQIPQPMVATREHLQKLQTRGIFSFWGFFPLTKDGMFVAIYPANGTKEKVVFVPYQKVLLSPMQIPFVEKLRTSIIGSPGCKFSIYIYPETLDKSIVEEVLGGELNPAPVGPFRFPRRGTGSGKEGLKMLGKWVGF
jgi:hypothetical protein